MLPLSNANCGIAVMAKASVSGRVKTRLVPPLTADEAAQFNTAFLRDISRNLLNARKYSPITPYMAFAPVGSEQFFKDHLPHEIGLIESQKATFGECLFHAIEELIEAGHSSACVLNADSPTLPVSYLIAAATALAADGDRIVIGPSTDGGYYFLGMKQAHRRLFEDIDWSTERVFQQTVDRAREQNLEIITLPTWYDIDEAETLRLLCGELLDNKPFRRVGETPPSAPASRELLRRLVAQAGLAQRIGYNMVPERISALTERVA